MIYVITLCNCVSYIIIGMSRIRQQRFKNEYINIPIIVKNSKELIFVFLPFEMKQIVSRKNDGK